MLWIMPMPLRGRYWVTDLAEKMIVNTEAQNDKDD